jgi:hypothetical protein
MVIKPNSYAAKCYDVRRQGKVDSKFILGFHNVGRVVPIPSCQGIEAKVLVRRSFAAFPGEGVGIEENG